VWQKGVTDTSIEKFILLKPRLDIFVDEMDNCLFDLYCRCLISYDTALSRARSPDRITRRTE
jgi:hypothetical protein